MSTMIPKEKLCEMYTKMLQIRKLDEKIAYFFTLGKVHGTTHLYIGEEATAVGVCSALKDTDYMTSTHRGHGHCIAKGIDLNRMMAEMLGKYNGYCRGKGGSMHIADLERGNLGANGVVGGGFCIATGAALMQQMKHLNNITVCFFGDGASNEGNFHESANLAAIWKLPVIFLCENNMYAMSTPQKYSMNIEHISDRASAYGIKGLELDGNNVIEVYNALCEARDYVIHNGPMLITCNTYRYMGHSRSDANVYRTKEEIADWRNNRDPIDRMKKYLLENGFTQSELDKIDEQTTADIEEAVDYAEKCEYPGLDTLLTDVYA